jgi:hypothetical protein
MKIQPVLRALAFLVLFGCLMQGALAYKAAGAISEAVTSMQLSFRSFERSLDQSTTLGDLGQLGDLGGYGQYQRPSQPPRPTAAPKDFSGLLNGLGLLTLAWWTLGGLVGACGLWGGAKALDLLEKQADALAQLARREVMARAGAATAPTTGYAPGAETHTTTTRR